MKNLTLIPVVFSWHFGFLLYSITQMFAILPLDFKSTTYSIGMTLNFCFHPNTGQHRSEDRGWGFDQKKKKKNHTPVCHWSSLNRALWLWAVNPFMCLCSQLIVPRMIKMISWNVLGDLVVKNPPYKAGTQVRSLVREIRSHMPRSNQICMTQLVRHKCHNYSQCTATKGPECLSEDLTPQSK